MERYDSYKDSGVAWLGEVPSHWEVKQVKRICRFCYGEALAGENRLDGQIPVFGSNGIVGVHNSPNTLSPVIIVGRKGSFGKITYSDRKSFVIDTAYFVDSSVTKEQMKWLFYTLSCVGLDNYSKDSAVPGLSREDAYEKFIVVPSHAEQDRIVNFLDQKTAEIDAAIAKKQRLIELLQEQKSILINQAVTRGLDPNVPMKDSGVEWIGQIPAHWESRRIKHATKRIYDCKNRTPEYFPSGKFFVIRTTNVKHGAIDMEGALFTDEKCFNEWTKKGLPRAGELVITREAPAGEVALLPKDFTGCLGQRTMGIVPNEKEVTGKLLLYFLQSQSFKKYVINSSSGSTVTHLRVGQIFDIPIVYPKDTSEQVKITEYIDNMSDCFSQNIEYAQNQISQLIELKSILVTEAVTGKIKV